MWLDYADKSESIDSRLVLVGTKSDLEEERMISHQQGKYLADKYKIPFFEVHGGSNAKCHEVV